MIEISTIHFSVFFISVQKSISIILMQNKIPNIKIFKTETLTEEFKEYGFTDYDGKDSSSDYSEYLNNDSIKLINEFYKKDFELFNYDMIKTDNEDDDIYENFDGVDGDKYGIDYFNMFRYIIIFILVMYLIFSFIRKIRI